MPKDATAILDEQFERERESWKPAHERAMECRDVEEEVRRGLSFFFMIRTGDEAWSRDVQSGAQSFSADVAREIRRQYEWWLEPCGEVLDLIQKAERTFEVENAAVFRRCVALARRILRSDTESLIDSFAQAERGELEVHSCEG